MEKLCSIGDAEDRVEFIEQLAVHLREAHFDTTKDPMERKISEMINLIEAQQVILSPGTG